MNFSFIGETSTPIKDGDETRTVYIGEQYIEAKPGNIVVYGKSEFVYLLNNDRISKLYKLGTWREFYKWDKLKEIKGDNNYEYFFESDKE